MREYLKLQLKLKWGYNRNNDKKSAVMTVLASLIAVVIVLALVWALTFVLRASLAVSAKRLCVMYLTAVMAGLTVAAVGMQVRRLYRPGDLTITARFPLTPFQIFVSGLLLNYIDLSIYSTVLLLPVMIMFGVAMQCFTALYVLGILLGILLMPLIPFALSVLIAIPVVYVTNFLERYDAVRLVLFIAFLVGCFFLYDRILTDLAGFFIHRDWETGTLEIWDKVLAGLDSYYNPAYYLGNVMFFERFWLGLGVLLGAGVVLTAAGVVLARIVCGRLRIKALEGGFGARRRKSAIDGYGSTRAIFRYSLKEILRNKTYFYFYLGVAISTPVMVFFCNRLVELVGEAQIGSGVNFGAAMLTLSVFMAMICSFSASVLSIEGKTAYISKLVPVPYRRQLTVKGLLYVGVGIVALAISTIVMGSLGFVNASEMAVLIITQLLFSVGLVFNGINLNLGNPNLKPKANGEVEEINITYMLLIGFAIAAILGAAALIFPRTAEGGAAWAYGITVAVAFAYAVINALIFWFAAEKRYRKIEM